MKLSFNKKNKLPSQTRSSSETSETGKSAESRAEQYLCQHGLTLETKNYLCRRGEIDLIMRDAKTLVFVEVRFRQSAEFGSALDTVTVKKQQKITLAAQHYIQQNNISDTTPLRFDVIGITGEDLQWIKSAF